MVAAGNMTDYRAMPADVGVVTHPGFRGRGWARRLVSHMTAEQLPTVGVVRYRALQTNLPSLAVASSLGFIGRGEDLASAQGDVTARAPHQFDRGGTETRGSDPRSSASSGRVTQAEGTGMASKSVPLSSSCEPPARTTAAKG